MRRIIRRRDVGLMIRVHVEHMIRSPTDCEYGDDGDEHPNDLEQVTVIRMK